MSFNHKHYVPCIRWKQGEYQALSYLKPDTKKYITPLIEVPEIGFDFETWQDKHTIDEHLEKLAKRIKKKWGSEKGFIDSNIIDPNKTMKDGTHHFSFIFSDLQTNGINGIPVTGTERKQVYNDAIKQIQIKYNLELCIRIGIEQSAKKNFSLLLNDLLNYFQIKANNSDLIIDLGTPSFTSIEGFSKAIQFIFNNFPYINEWKSFSIIGTSFPKTMGGIKLPVEYKSRQEWLLYNTLISSLNVSNFRLPTFGDYTISHPQVIKKDMRIIKPSASIRYTTDEDWCIVKGTSVKSAGGFQQFHDLSRTLVKLPCYLGRDFSYGDKYIYDCAHAPKNTKCGSLSTWRMIGTNHHIEKVFYDLANLFSS